MRQNKDRDGRGLRFRGGFRGGTRAGAGLDCPGPPFPGEPDGRRAASDSGVPCVTADATSAMVDPACEGIVSSWSAGSRPVGGGADATEAPRPGLTVNRRGDGGVEDHEELAMS